MISFPFMLRRSDAELDGIGSPFAATRRCCCCVIVERATGGGCTPSNTTTTRTSFGHVTMAQESSSFLIVTLIGCGSWFWPVADRRRRCRPARTMTGNLPVFRGRPSSSGRRLVRFYVDRYTGYITFPGLLARMTGSVLHAASRSSRDVVDRKRAHRCFGGRASGRRDQQHVCPRFWAGVGRWCCCSLSVISIMCVLAWICRYLSSQCLRASLDLHGDDRSIVFIHFCIRCTGCSRKSMPRMSDGWVGLDHRAIADRDRHPCARTWPDEEYEAARVCRR